MGFKIKYPKEDIPPVFDNIHLQDVTEQYFPVMDLDVELQFASPVNAHLVYLCTFNNKSWEPISWGEILSEGKARFKKVVKNIVYLPMYYADGKYLPASDPILLLNTGEIKRLIADKSKLFPLQIDRKYPLWPEMKKHAAKMIGGYFQVSNTADFSGNKTVFKITEQPLSRLQFVNLKNIGTFRYARYVFPHTSTGDAAELEFWAGNKLLHGKIFSSPEIDSNSQAKFFNNKYDDFIQNEFYPDKFIGLDFEQPVAIDRIGFCPRNDANWIIAGHDYELSYWDKKWISLGIKSSNDFVLKYNNIPLGALLLIKDITEGKEHRIFTFKKQIISWW